MSTEKKRGEKKERSQEDIKVEGEIENKRQRKVVLNESREEKERREERDEWSKQKRRVEMQMERKGVDDVEEKSKVCYIARLVTREFG